MAQIIGRRAFIGGAAAVLAVPFAITFVKSSGPTSIAARAAGAPSAGTSLNAYLKIDTFNIVTLAIGSSEMGQGIMTGLAQLVAEELMLSWDQVRVEHAPAVGSYPNPYANPLFNAQVTGGSTSMRGWYLPLRQASAIAREVLLRAARKTAGGGQWRLAPGGKVTDGTTIVPFSDLVARASRLKPPATATLANTRTFIGKSMSRTDVPAKVDGSAVFGSDVQLPGIVFASVVHCPTLGGTVGSAPTSVGGALAVVNLGDSVGVVANDTWTAMELANGLANRINWTLPANTASRDTASIRATGAALLASTSVTPSIYETAGGDPAAILAAATTKIDATYELPYLAHACMEVLNCTANVTATSCEVWAPTQGQQFCVYTIQAITGLPMSAITVHTTYLGGGLGRKIEQDYIAQAVKISKAIGKPVKMTWSRKQDFQNDKYRPCATIRVQAAVDDGQRISALLYRNVSPSINIQRNTVPGNNPEDTGAVAGALNLPYAIANRRIEYVPNPADIPLGYWRSVGESYNTFAVESAVDELAAAAGIDPMAFRKTQAAGDARLTGVLRAVDTLSGWTATGAPAGSAFGLAALSGFGSYIAIVAQIALRGPQVVVQKMFYAIDCGVVVNPDLVLSQVQGGAAHGIAATLWGEVTFAAGKPNVVNFSNYRMLRLAEMPEVALKIVSSTAAPGGVGETGVPCVAPAIANAYARLSGQRIRTLPFYPGARMSDG